MELPFLEVSNKQVGINTAECGPTKTEVVGKESARERAKEGRQKGGTERKKGGLKERKQRLKDGTYSYHESRDKS